MPTFFDRFTLLCRENGETPNSLGKKLGIPSGSITAWKKGTMPRMKTLDLLANYFHVSVDYLVGNVNDPFFYLDNERIKREINSYGDETEKAPTPVSESGRRINIVKIAGRDGSYKEKRLTDEQVKALQTIIDQMPEAPEDL